MLISAWPYVVTAVGVWVATDRLTASASYNLALALLVLVGAASVLLAWTCVAVLALAVSLATSLDDFPQLAKASLYASAPAMWLPCAIALLSVSTPETTAIALLLIANTIRLLVARTWPSGGAPMRRRSSRTLLFRYAGNIGGTSETMPAMVGAFAIHAAAWAVWAGYALLSALLVTIGAAGWTASAVMRTPAPPPAQRNLRTTAACALIVFVLAASLSIGQQTGGVPGPAHHRLVSASRLAWDRLAYGRQLEESRPAKQPVTKLASLNRDVILPAKDLVPGVILRPDKPHAQSIVVPGVLRAGRAILDPFVLPFTGEYHLFPTSSGEVQQDSVVYRGTPLDAVYRNVAGGPIETEAYQPLDPSIDFTNCEKVRLTLKHREITPGLATMRLVSAGGQEELGSEVFGMERTPEETLDFIVPASPHLARVTAIRIGFRCDPSRRSESTKVAIVQFTLVPRSL